MADKTSDPSGDPGAQRPVPPEAVAGGPGPAGAPGPAEAGPAAEARLDPAVRALLQQARVDERRAAGTARAHYEALGRAQQAHAAWARVRGDAIPPDLAGPALWRAYAARILELGRVLQEGGWRARLDAVAPGPPAKGYAVELLRRAMDGDREAVEAMAHGAVDTSLTLGLEADGWLREGLMYEVLGIQPPPEPPRGWEGDYHEAVESAADFVRWIDREMWVAELVDTWRGSGGRLVRNAFRLVSHLGLPDLPLEPLGPLSPADELAVLRNLRRLCAQRLGLPAEGGRRVEQPAAAAPAAADAGQPGGATAEAAVARYLASSPNASLEEAATATGLSANRVRRTGAWKEHEERLLAGYLGGHPEADTGDVKRALGLSRPKVVGMRAWQEHQARRQAARPPRRAAGRPLTAQVLACRPDASAADPADVAERRDQLYREIVEGADPGTRAALHRLSAAQQGALLEHVLGQLGDLTGRDEGARRQLVVAVAQSWLEEQEQQRRGEGRARWEARPR